MMIDWLDTVLGFLAALLLAFIKAYLKSKKLASLNPPPNRPSCENCPIIQLLKDDAKIIKRGSTGIGFFLFLYALAALVTLMVMES